MTEHVALLTDNAELFGCLRVDLDEHPSGLVELNPGHQVAHG